MLDPVIFNAGLEMSLDNYLAFLAGVVAHELGHDPTKNDPAEDHKEFGLMQEGAAMITSTDFRAETIKRFRLAIDWETTDL